MSFALASLRSRLIGAALIALGGFAFFAPVVTSNRAPFFQSFMEVRVESSKQRVVLALHGVDGPLRWRDLETRGAVVPNGAKPDDPVELNVAYQRK